VRKDCRPGRDKKEGSGSDFKQKTETLRQRTPPGLPSLMGDAGKREGDVKSAGLSLRPCRYDYRKRGELGAGGNMLMEGLSSIVKAKWLKEILDLKGKNYQTI